MKQRICERETLVIRRLVLQPGESMAWHHDTCERFTVVVRGQRLAIEYRDTGEVHALDVHPGLTGWDLPEDRVHRAINVGDEPYEEVVTFYRAGPSIDPQPEEP